MSLDVAASEHGRVRVFALSMDTSEAEALRDSKDPALLGLEAWQSAYVEVFPVADLEEFGLAGYLETGCGIDRSALTPDLTKLTQLDGWVMVVFSKAFQGHATRLSPDPRVTLIATYSEPSTDWRDHQTLSSQAATQPGPAQRKSPSDAAMSGRIASLALLILFVLTALVIWVAA